MRIHTVKTKDWYNKNKNIGFELKKIPFNEVSKGDIVAMNVFQTKEKSSIELMMVEKIKHTFLHKHRVIVLMERSPFGGWTYNNYFFENFPNGMVDVLVAK